MPTEPRVAMNLEPGDEIQIMDAWWIVTRSDVSLTDVWASALHLVSRDRSSSMEIQAYPTQIFNCQPHCC